MPDSPKRKSFLKGENQDSYLYNKHTILRTTKIYKIMEVVKKQLKKKIAKIYKKKYFSENLKNQIKLELEIHECLRSSRSILLLESYFESEEYVFLIYEFGEILTENLDDKNVRSLKKKFRYFEKDKKYLKRFFCQILTALNEINSYQISVGILDISMIVNVSYGNFKIFNFCNLTNYNEK